MAAAFVIDFRAAYPPDNNLEHVFHRRIQHHIFMRGHKHKFTAYAGGLCHRDI